jgi:hypothetical protein
LPPFRTTSRRFPGKAQKKWHFVLVFNNVLARLRRLSPSSSIRTALVAGALLSFALSFDEIAVTAYLMRDEGSAAPVRQK